MARCPSSYLFTFSYRSLGASLCAERTALVKAVVSLRLSLILLDAMTDERASFVASKSCCKSGNVKECIQEDGIDDVVSGLTKNR